MIYKQREIVLISFPFSNYEQFKKRPVLIISNDNFNANNRDVLVCAITSQNFQNEYSVNLTSSDLEYGILPEASVIQSHKIHILEKNLILKKFSIINQYVLDEVIINIQKPFIKYDNL